MISLNLESHVINSVLLLVYIPLFIFLNSLSGTSVLHILDLLDWISSCLVFCISTILSFCSLLCRMFYLPILSLSFLFLLPYFLRTFFLFFFKPSSYFMDVVSYMKIFIAFLNLDLFLWNGYKGKWSEKRKMKAKLVNLV